MQKIIYQTSKRKRQHITYDGRNPICSVKHKHKATLLKPGTSKENNCKNCVRIWTALKRRRRLEFLKERGKR